MCSVLRSEERVRVRGQPRGRFETDQWTIEVTLKSKASASPHPSPLLFEEREQVVWP
jgi:hypothetical protein